MDSQPTSQNSVIPPSCSDGIQNQGETGIDCGGPCIPCQEFKAKIDGSDFNGDSVVVFVQTGGIYEIYAYSHTYGPSAPIVIPYIKLKTNTLQPGSYCFNLLNCQATANFRRYDNWMTSAVNGGMVISSLDTANQMITGTFECDVQTVFGSQFEITNGSFTIKYP